MLALTGDYKRIAHMTLTPYGVAPSADHMWLATLELEQPVRRRARVKAVGTASGPGPAVRSQRHHHIPQPGVRGVAAMGAGDHHGRRGIRLGADRPAERVTLSKVGARVRVAGLTGSPWALDTDCYSVSFTVTFNPRGSMGRSSPTASRSARPSGVSTYGWSDPDDPSRRHPRRGLRGEHRGRAAHRPAITWVPGATYLLTFTRVRYDVTATLEWGR